MTLRRLIPALLVALALPAAAAAQQPQHSVAPPGNSGIDEYLETLPGAGGGHATTAPGSGHGGAQLPASVRRRMLAQGPAGRAALSAAESTAPRRGGPAGHAPLSATREPSGTGFPSAIAKALGGSDQGGMGVWLPILLAVSALAAAGLAYARHRSSA